jgi:hypothetical protein
MTQCVPLPVRRSSLPRWYARNLAPNSYLPHPSPECLATNGNYLKSMAWCIHVHCGNGVGISKMESWWRLNIRGRQTDQPVPNMTYQHALSLISKPPTDMLDKGTVLNRTVSVSNESYINSYQQQTVYEYVETNSSKYRYETHDRKCLNSC